MRKFKLGLILIIVCISGYMQAQEKADDRYLEVRGTTELDMQTLPGVTATLYDGNTKVGSVQTGSDGTFSFKLEINKIYTIEVSKKDLIGKRISFDTHMPDDEKGSWMNEFSIGLVRFCNGVDYSALKQPVDRVKFDPKRREYISDKDYVNGMRPKIEAVLAKYDQCMMDKYQAAINKGDQAVTRKNMQEAITAYQEALEIYPKEEYPKKQIRNINNQLEKEQKTADQDQKRELQEKEDRFNQAMAKASVAYTHKDYENAKNYYQAALNVKPDEQLPQTRLQEIGTILAKKAEEDAHRRSEDNAYKAAINKADSLARSKDYNRARDQYAKAQQIKPGESYPKVKMQEVDRMEEADKRTAEAAQKEQADRAYKDLVEKADEQYKAKKYEEAETVYHQALAQRPSDPYPAQRIKAVENAITAQKQQEMAEQIDKQYKAIVEQADQLLTSGDLDKAREAYNKALSVKPGDDYAQSKLQSIDHQVAADQAARLKATEEGYKASVGAAKTAITQKDYEQARANFQKALDLKPGDPYATGKITEMNNLIADQKKAQEEEAALKTQVKEAVAKADQLYRSGDLQAARDAYESVIGMMPGNSYAVQQIKAIEDRQAASASRKQQKSDSAYAHYMSDGTDLFARKEYPGARENFQKALSIKPEDASATKKITETDDRIHQAEAEKESDQVKQKAYQTAVTEADAFMQQMKYPEASESYHKALSLMPAESYPQQKLDEITKIQAEQDRKLAQKEANDKAYDLAVANADKCMKVQDFGKAKDEYSRAANLKPDESYPKTQIAAVDKLIQAQQEEATRIKARNDAYAAAMNDGNRLYSSKRYADAKESYGEALKLMPEDKLASEQIARIDRILAAQARLVQAAEKAAKENSSAKVSVPKLSELNFSSESDRQRYFDDLKKKYPAGITLEIYHEQYREIRRYIIIRENLTQEFREVHYLSYNGYQYSVNGKPITQMYFLSQVKPRAGENYKEVEM